MCANTESAVEKLWTTDVAWICEFIYVCVWYANYICVAHGDMTEQTAV